MGEVTSLATVIRPFIATSTRAPGLPTLQTTASALGANLVSGGAMGAASTSIVTASLRGTHEYVRDANYYRYTGNTGNCHGGGGGRTSGFSAWDIRTSAPCRRRGTSLRRKLFPLTH